MKLRVLLVGLVGGIAASAVMQYPLYRYLPGKIIAEWPAAQSGLAWGLVAVTAVLLLACGALAARLSGASHRMGAFGAGAVAGLMTAVIVQLTWGSAAAGVWGGREMLSFGMKPAASETIFTGMLAEAVVSTMWWSFASVWLAISAGLTLGGIGGYIAGPGGSPAKPLHTFWAAVSVAGALTAALSAIVSAAIYALLVTQTEKTAVEAGRTLSFSSQSILDWPLGTHLVLLAAWLFVCWLTVRRARPETALARGTLISAALVNGVLPVVVVLMLLLVNRGLFLMPVPLAGMALSLAGGFLAVRQGLLLLRQPKPPAAVPPVTVSFFSALVALCGGIMLADALIGSAASLNIVTLLIPLITVQDPAVAGPPTATMAANVGVNYSLQSAFAFMGGLALLGLMALTALVVWGVQWLQARRSAPKVIPPSAGDAGGDSRSVV